MQIPNLRELRELHGLTQKELAGVSGVSLRSVAGYEGGAHVRPNTARKLAQALNVEVADLVGAASYPKAQAPPSPEQPRFNGLLEEEPRMALEILFDNLRMHITGTADRWIRAAETGLMFWSEDATIAYSIEVNNEAAHLYGFVAEGLEPALEGLLSGTLTLRSEQRKLWEAMEHLKKAVEIANNAADAVAPPSEPTEEEWAAAGPILDAIWEEMDEVKQHRLLREFAEEMAAECEHAAEDLRGRIA